MNPSDEELMMRRRVDDLNCERLTWQRSPLWFPDEWAAPAQCEARIARYAKEEEEEDQEQEQVCQEDPPEPFLSTNQKTRAKQGGLWLAGWSTGGKLPRSRRRINPWKVRGNPGNQVVEEQGRSGRLQTFPLSFERPSFKFAKDGYVVSS